MKGNGAKSEATREEAIVALLSSRTVDEAAESVGIAAKTLYRWQREPEFAAQYRDARRTAFSQSISRLQHMCSAAVSTLGKLMVDPSTPASTRVRAAESILSHSAKAIEIEDIEARVAELERAAETAKS